MATLADVRRRALAALVPPPRLQLSEWIEREIVLPEGTSALPGKVRLWPYQREIADAISDPLIERVTSGGNRGNQYKPAKSQRATVSTPKLSDLGISKSQSS